LASVVFAASLASAMTIVAPSDPGRLALDSEAVLLVRAGRSSVERQGALLVTRTELEVVDRVRGLPAPGDLIELEVPGGELDGIGFVVAGTPRFEPGQVYLVFADLGSDGAWHPRLMADSVMRRDVDLAGSPILMPVDESAGIGRLAVGGGSADPVLMPVYETEFLAHLRDVLATGTRWTPARVRVPLDLMPAVTKAAPPGCAFIDWDGLNIRWRLFDTGGSLAMYAEDTADASISGGGYTEVQEALASWTAVPSSSLSVYYGGTKDVGTSWCSSGNPPSGADTVVFNDPCDDISDLTGCSGTLAYGGPWFGSTHTYDGETWYTATSWFVVVNDGAGCLGSTNYRRMLAHEMGHGLGFGHVADPGALMYYQCCNDHNALDIQCTQYTYPEAGSPPATNTPTPPAPGSPTFTPTRTPTRTPTVGVSTPTRTPTRTPTPPPASTPTPTRTRTPTRTPTPYFSPTPTPPARPEMIMVPVVAHVDGVGGTPWRSDLSITNREGVPIEVKLRYQPAADTTLSRRYNLQAHQTLLFEDIVQSVFRAGDGRGPIRLETAGVDIIEPAVASRTVAERSFGTFGQGMPAVVRPQAGTSYLPGVRHDDDYRSNVAVTAMTDSAVVATFSLYRGHAGLVAGGVSRTVAAGEQRQWSLDQLFPGHARAGEPMTVDVRLSSPGVAYASVVDNASTDAVTYLGTEPAHDWVVPAVAHTAGKDGTFWSSDVTVANLDASDANVDLEYLPEKIDNSAGGMLRSRLRIRSGSTHCFEDVVLDEFGVDDGKGVLRISSSRPIVVTSRAWTAGPNGGTTGHGLRTVVEQALGRDTTVLPGIRVQDGFRTNVGVVTGETWASVRLRLRDQNGSEHADTYVNVPARSMRQWSLESLFGASQVKKLDPTGSLVVESDADFVAYLVVIDGSSQDPVFFLPTRD
jgi:hypothetical protein